MLSAESHGVASSPEAYGYGGIISIRFSVTLFMAIVTSNRAMIPPNGGLVSGYQSLRACRSSSAAAQPPRGRDRPRTPPASLPMRCAVPGEGVGTATICDSCIRASIMCPCRWCTWTARACASTGHRDRRTAYREPGARTPRPASPHHRRRSPAAVHAHGSLTLEHFRPKGSRMQGNSRLDVGEGFFIGVALSHDYTFVA